MRAEEDLGRAILREHVVDPEIHRELQWLVRPGLAHAPPHSIDRATRSDCINDLTDSSASSSKLRVVVWQKASQHGRWAWAMAKQTSPAALASAALATDQPPPSTENKEQIERSFQPATRAERGK